jgi:prepilin-type N-terminal cleavage/methylation domain-containing protein
MNKHAAQAGFTLVEMAIALVIIALLIGGMLTPLTTQKEQERRSRNQQLLEEAREALIGYAIVNRRLPCPDTDAPNSPGSGLENPCTGDSSQSYPGRLPWVTLGIDAEYDPWGETHFIGYRVSGAFVGDPGTGTFTLNASGTAPGIIEIHSDATACGSTANLVASNVPAVIWSGAKTDYTPAPVSSADERENTDNDACFVYRNHNTLGGSEFDDQMVWLSPSILFNRMISAGQLP